MTPSDSQSFGLHISTSTKLIISLALFFLMLVALSLIVQALSGLVSLSERDVLLAGVWVQDIFVFALPALLYTFLPQREYLSTMKNPGRSLSWLIAAMLVIIAIPLINQTAAWNTSWFDGITSGFWKSAIDMEHAAAETTAKLLSAPGVSGLIVSVLTVGILTGLCEELFFRQMLLTSMRSFLGTHLAVWVVAIIFSLVHFQIFGLLPRMLMGAMFGYIFVYSGSIWPAVAAHALNNSMVVVATWLASRGAEIQADDFGVSATFPWMSILSVVAIAALIFVLKQRGKASKELISE